MKHNGKTVVTGHLADGVVQERENYLKQLLKDIPEISEKAREGREPISLDSLILAMTAYIGLWVNETFDDNEALKQYMVSTICNSLHLVCGYEVETEFHEPAERAEH